MAAIITLTDGVFNIPLVYNASNQHYFKSLYGMKITPGEAVPTWHDSDGFPPQLIDLYNPNRQAFLEFHVLPTSATNPANTLQNALALLRRWVDGADQQAARFHIVGDVNRVDLKVQRDGSTIATYHPVLYGAVDDSDAHWNAPATLNDMVYGAVIALTLAPAGEAENLITLNNVLFGASFEFESGVSGVGAGWSTTGTVTPTLDTAVYLLNGKSQKCDASTSGGVMSTAIAATTTSGVAYAWAYVVSGSVDIDLYDSSATAVMDTATLDATDSGGVSDNSYLDFNGHTWWRVPLSSASLTNTNNHRIRLRASGGAAVWYVGCAYLEFGRTDAPLAWSSDASVLNRGDLSTSNVTYKNWTDVWGIPGDVDALVRFTIAPTVTGSNGEKFTVSAFKDKAGMLAANFDHYIECEDFTSDTATAGSWADTVVAGTSAGSVARFTATGSGGGSITVSAPYTNYPLVVMVRAAASVGSLITLSLGTPATGVSPVIETKTVTLTTDYVDYDLGRIHLRPPVDSGSTAANLTLVVTCTANTQTVDLDRVMLMPIIDGRLLVETDLFTGNMGSGFTIDGINEETFMTYRIPDVGTYPTAASGQQVTRFYYNRYDSVSSEIHYLDDALTVALEILPRTRQLLGTI